MKKSGKQDRLLLFSYAEGVREMEKKIGDVKVATAAILRGFKVVWAGIDSKRKSCGSLYYLKPDANESTLGLVFVVLCEQLNLLDTLLGVRRGIYKRETIEVEHPCGIKFPVYIYDHPTGNLPPEIKPSSREYSAHLELVYTASYWFHMVKGKPADEDDDQPCDCKVFNPEALSHDRYGPDDIPLISTSIGLPAATDVAALAIKPTILPSR